MLNARVWIQAEFAVFLALDLDFWMVLAQFGIEKLWTCSHQRCCCCFVHYLVGGISNMNFIFHTKKGIILPNWLSYFFKMFKTTNQLCVCVYFKDGSHAHVYIVYVVYIVYIHRPAGKCWRYRKNAFIRCICIYIYITIIDNDKMKIFICIYLFIICALWLCILYYHFSLWTK